MSVYEKLKELQIALPDPITPAAAFVMTARTGNLLFVSGHIAKREGKPWAGQLGAELGTQEGKQAARNAAIDVLATMQHALGDLNKVQRIVKVLSLINSSSRFTEHHLVANGASELFQEVFGEKGKHARSAIGVAQLPLGACFEIELVAEVAE
ncbi:MAG TPA: RidA family protein [Candidatus Dormibacteraeota bacterium]|jgi:enamine deaminase RidA (YjgF/YER057c/UK114 family)|nr:RidA family protein [Candidatus Dormibacteraeota bacterium]